MTTRYLIAPITHPLHGCDVLDDAYPRQCNRPATWRVWGLGNVASPGKPKVEAGPIFLVCDHHIHRYASARAQQHVREHGPADEWDTAQAIMIGDGD